MDSPYRSVRSPGKTQGTEIGVGGYVAVGESL